MRVKTVLMYDPPAGWMYGFPKPYKPFPGESLRETLLRDGYPIEELVRLGENLYVRFYETEVMEDD